MFVPISWLKDYVKINLPLEKLMWKMTEIGLTTESFQKKGKEIILDVEVTPNRPDWMSMVGIARELATLQNENLKLPEIRDIPKPKKKLALDIVTDFNLCPRYSSIIISQVEQKPSPKWLQNRLKLLGLRPINNLVDITNYVMYEMGNPIHVFDYDKLKNQKVVLTKSKGKEKFISVDGLSYTLPKNAIIFKSANVVVDLCGIKGGFNSGVNKDTKNILILVAVYNGVLVRRASQKLGLSSDASKIFERGANLGGTLKTLSRVVNLVGELAGGEIASDTMDVKKQNYGPWELELGLNNLNSVLGIEIPEKKVVHILSKLELSPHNEKGKITCIIPTFRSDLKMEADLIEEVARFWGYNNFPKTLPKISYSIKKPPYYYDYSFELDLKNFMVSCGYTETKTLSLISRKDLLTAQLNPNNHLKIANPVSREYEYMRTSLIPHLLKAVKLNKEYGVVRLFELSKVYLGKPQDTSEPLRISAVCNTSFKEIKGIVDTVMARLNIDSYKIKPFALTKSIWHPSKSGVIELKNETIGFFGEIHPSTLTNFDISAIFAFEFDIGLLFKLKKDTLFKQIPSHPPQKEDLTVTLPKNTMVGEVIKTMRRTKDVQLVELTKTYKDANTFRIWYQNPSKTLNNKEVEKIRKKLLLSIKSKYGGVFKN